MCYLLSLEKGEDPETLKARLNKFCSGTVDHSLSSKWSKEGTKEKTRVGKTRAGHVWSWPLG